MINANELVGRYLGIWNETEAERRHNLIEQTWTESASYIDPLKQGEGRKAIDALVQGVHAQFAGHRFRQTGQVDAHHDFIRFSWELVQEGGPVVAAGTDFGVIAADGRLQSITGFLDHMPASSPQQ